MLKIDRDDLSELIGLLYEASAQSHLWPKFCTHLMTHLQSDEGNIFLHEIETGLPRVEFVTTPSEFLLRYFEHYHTVNPYYQRGIPYMRDGFIGLSHEMCPPEEFEETEFHQDYFRQLGLFHSCVMIVHGGNGLLVCISFARSKKAGIYNDDEERLMRFLMPHAHRAFKITDLIAELDGRYKFLVEALDKLPQSVMVVSRDGGLIAINTSAKRITDRCDGLSIDKQGKLQAATSDESCRLRRLIGFACQPCLDVQLNYGDVLQLSRPSGLRPLSLLVAPLSHDNSGLNPKQPSALIFITDPESGMETSEQIVQRLYQLTPAEARLTVLLTQGMSVAESSAELQVTTNTIRTHLKHIFQKTGARRQSELVKLLINSPAVVE
jgi:DNA-binding CsgD family transcriptional regulator